MGRRRTCRLRWGAFTGIERAEAVIASALCLGGVEARLVTAEEPARLWVAL